MRLTDAAFVVWIVGGTLVIKAMLRAVHRGTLPRVTFLVPALVIAILPMLVLKVGLAEHTVVAVVAAGVSLFWFAILIARMNNAP
jgi:hypothetical protein